MAKTLAEAKVNTLAGTLEDLDSKASVDNPADTPAYEENDPHSDTLDQVRAKELIHTLAVRNWAMVSA